jgi:hypothetical protein
MPYYADLSRLPACSQLEGCKPSPFGGTEHDWDCAKARAFNEQIRDLLELD